MSATVRNQWIVVSATLVIGLGLLLFGRGAADGSVEVTIVPADAVNLGCEGAVGELSCASKDRPLCPFVTTSGRLVALPGLFTEPAVAAWLQHPVTPDQRVRVKCRARRLAMAAPISIRFSAGEVFKPTVADVAEISGCEVK